LGAQIKDDNTGVRVTQVPAGHPAQKAGIQVGDQILAVGEYVVDSKKLLRLIKSYRDSAIPLTLIRDGRILSAQLHIDPIAPTEFALTIACDRTFTSYLESR
jgi:predicted metalloprotease with PDZ domain